MKKRTVGLLLALSLIMTGCGSSAVPEPEEVQKQEETESDAEQENGAGEDVTQEKEISYEEEEDIFVASSFDTSGEPFSVSEWEVNIEGCYRLTESIDIYSYWGTLAGYTKPDIYIKDGCQNGEWICLSFVESSYLVKAEDFDRVVELVTKEEYDAAKRGETVPESSDSFSPNEAYQNALAVLDELIDSEKIYTSEEFAELLPQIFDKMDDMEFNPELVEAVFATNFLIIILCCHHPNRL